MSGFADFVGDHTVTRFIDFCSSEDERVSIVNDCYYGVEEGVDMWLREDSTHFDPRFSYLTFCLFLCYETLFDYMI